jgi:drug/metabolite transporter (DMT)-like permease
LGHSAANVGDVSLFGCVVGRAVAYVIWYSAVQKLGGSRTAVYSNITPLVAMVVAAIWLGEPLTLPKLAGAAAVIAGVAITKLERKMIPPPVEA